jgi:hypothetical protein
MKKFLLSTISTLLALILFSTQLFAYSGTINMANSANATEAVTSFDEAEIYGAFEEINELVAMLEGDADITYSGLEAENSDLLVNLSSTSSVAMTATSSDGPPIISAFWWGCLLSWVGMLIVGVTTGFDGYHIRKSGWGCLLSALVWGTGGCFYYY